MRCGDKCYERGREWGERGREGEGRERGKLGVKVLSENVGVYERENQLGGHMKERERERDYLNESGKEIHYQRFLQRTHLPYKYRHAHSHLKGKKREGEEEGEGERGRGREREREWEREGGEREGKK